MFLLLTIATVDPLDKVPAKSRYAESKEVDPPKDTKRDHSGMKEEELNEIRVIPSKSGKIHGRRSQET
jgi:hypothetical protein